MLTNFSKQNHRKILLAPSSFMPITFFLQVGHSFLILRALLRQMLQKGWPQGVTIASLGDERLCRGSMQTGHSGGLRALDAKELALAWSTTFLGCCLGKGGIW